MATDSPLARGNAALASGDVQSAVAAFTEALAGAPSADVHEALARAHIKGGAHLEAAEAALKAITLDAGMAKAYLRRGVALFHLDEFESALEAFEKGKELRPTLAAFDTWMRKCNAEINGDVEVVEPPKPAGSPKITIIPAPPREGGSAAAAAVSSSGDKQPAAAAVRQQQGQQQREQKDMGPITAVAGVPAPNKIRHQWYQLGDKVVVDVYAKGLPQERFVAEFAETRLRLAVLRDGGGGSGGGGGGGGQQQAATQGEAQPGEGAPDGPEWELDVELFGPVDAAACRYEVLRSKVEVTLRKAPAAAGKAWPTLEAAGGAALKAPPDAAVGVVAAPEAPPAGGPPRVYPSSKGPKDWDAVEREVKELEAKGELDDGDPLNSFFKKIFAQGDEDTRRAMQKSFVESNGTVLSTNWSEVGAKPVECTPPDGMEVKKWGED